VVKISHIKRGENPELGPNTHVHVWERIDIHTNILLSDLLSQLTDYIGTCRYSCERPGYVNTHTFTCKQTDFGVINKAVQAQH